MSNDVNNNGTPGSVFDPPANWGIDDGLSDAEASFQTAMDLGALATELDEYLKSSGNDQAAITEINRLISVIKAYEQKYNLDPKVTAWANTLITTLGFGVNQTTADAYLNAYRKESAPGKQDDIVSQILAWAFPKSGSWPYTPNTSANADTKYAALRFMASFYGNGSPDADNNMEGFFSQDGGFCDFATQAGVFLSLYLEDHNNVPTGGASYHDEIIQTFALKDPDNKLPSFEEFLGAAKEEWYTPFVSGDLGISLEDAMNDVGALLSDGFEGNGSSSASSGGVSGSNPAGSSGVTSDLKGLSETPADKAAEARAAANLLRVMAGAIAASAQSSSVTPLTQATTLVNNAANLANAEKNIQKVVDAIDVVNEALKSKGLTANAPKSNGSVKGSGGGLKGSGPLPPPPELPPTGAPDGSVPAGGGYNWGNGSDPYYDKLMQFLEYFGYVKTNDAGALFNFANFIAGLSQPISPIPQGMSPGPDGQFIPMRDDPKLVALLQKSGAQDMIKAALEQAIEYAFFGSSDPTKAGQNMKDYIKNLSDTLKGLKAAHDNPFIDAMLQEVDSCGVLADAFIKQHTVDQAFLDANPNFKGKIGDLIWIDKGSGCIFDWTNPQDGSQYGDKFMIEMEIGAQGNAASGKLINALKGLLAEYKINTLNELLKQFSDPIFAILLWIMMYYDQNTQGQESGENDQAKVMSDIITNKFANGLQSLASEAGSWGGADVDKLKQLLENSDVFNSLAPEASSVAENWQQNVTGPIEKIQINVGGKTESLKDYLDDPSISSDDKATTLNTVFQPNPPSSGSPTYQANTNYQILTQATTTGTQLANGQSKNITTELGTLSTLESAIDKTMDQIVNQTSGLMAMMKAFVNAQRSN
jgi:hypothetical protein